MSDASRADVVATKRRSSEPCTVNGRACVTVNSFDQPPSERYGSRCNASRRRQMAPVQSLQRLADNRPKAYDFSVRSILNAANSGSLPDRGGGGGGGIAAGNRGREDAGKGRPGVSTGDGGHDPISRWWQRGDDRCRSPGKDTRTPM